MFDIGFLELVLLSVVSLVVLGPERLPGAIRTVSLWIGRLRRSFNTIKQDIEKEIGADEIRRQLRNEAIMEKFKHTKTQVTNTIDSVKKEADTIRRNVELEADAAALTSKPTAKPDATIAPPGSDAQPDGPSATAKPTESPAATTTTSSTPEAAPAASATPSTAPGSDTAGAPNAADILATETEKS